MKMPAKSVKANYEHIRAIDKKARKLMVERGISFSEAWRMALDLKAAEEVSKRP